MSLHARQDMSGMDMGDDDMNMNSGGYNNYTLQQDLWIVVGCMIAFATLINVFDHILLHQRLKSNSARPRSLFWLSWATITAIGRELYSAPFPALKIRGFQIPSLILGPITTVLAYFLILLVFSFIGTVPSDSWNWETVAVRIGCINQAQLPLIFLLAGKQNIIGWLTGISYERLNWLHRWVARTLWVGITMHMGFLFRSWMQWDYVKVKLATDNMTQTGFAAWCILTAIMLLSFAPARRWNYELFIISHVVLFAGLLGAVMIHVDDGVAYIWACVALYFFDRVARFIVACVCNIGLIRGTSFWANRAVIIPLPGGVTRVTIDKPVVSWSPGQHMFLSCHAIAPLQSHPFTVSSLPSDNKIEFLIQSRSGGTKRIGRWASNGTLLQYNNTRQTMVGIEGPYGKIRPLKQFDSVVLLAGGTGATFTVPLMRDLVRTWSQLGSTIVTRKIRWVWAVKSEDRTEWFRSRLEQALSDVEEIRQQRSLPVELDISIYITCDDQMVGDTSIGCNTRERRKEIDFGAAKSGAGAAMSAKTVEVDSIDVSSDEGCGPNGSCCCRSTVTDEKQATKCCCCMPSSSSSQKSSKQQIKILAGRPHVRNIIQLVLEEAEGESAIIACGPQGLQDDVRRNTVSLSDERAVHKGTGAQGIYLHIERFGY